MTSQANNIARRNGFSDFDELYDGMQSGRVSMRDYERIISRRYGRNTRLAIGGSR